MITDITLGTTQLLNSNRFCLGISNLSFPMISYSSVKKGSFPGQKIAAGKFSSFKFALEWIIVGSSFSDLAVQRETFAKLMGEIIKDETKTLKISKSNGVNIQIDVKAVTVSGDIKAEQGVGSSLLTEFEAEYPFLVSQSQVNQDVFIFAGGGMSIPMSIPMDMSVGAANEVMVTNNGNYEAYPIFTLYGPLTNPSLTNFTTNKTLNINYTLADSSSYIVIDCFLRTALLYPSKTNVRQYISGDFWTMAIGSNTIRLSNVSVNPTGKCVVNFRDHYLGI